MDREISASTKNLHDNHQVFETIERFIEKEDEIKRIFGQETISFDLEVNRKANQIKSVERENGLLAIELIRVKNQYLYCFRTIVTKLKYLSSANIYALNHNNFLVLASNCRNIIEQIAALVYQIRKGNECIDSLQKVTNTTEVRKAITDYQDTLNKVFYGTRFFKQDGLVDAINVLTLIDKYLTKELGEVRRFYDFLSDFVHPNFGSNILVTSGVLAAGVVDPPYEEKKEIVKQVLNGTQTLYTFLDEKIINFSKIGIQLEDYLAKVLNRDLTFGQIFSNNDISFTGDGKSKETAIFFLKAITHMDYVKFQYEFIAKNLQTKGDDILGQSIGDIDSDFVYDIISTTKGNVWFKTPKKKLST